MALVHHIAADTQRARLVRVQKSLDGRPGRRVRLARRVERHEDEAVGGVVSVLACLPVRRLQRTCSAPAASEREGRQ